MVKEIKMFYVRIFISTTQVSILTNFKINRDDLIKGFSRVIMDEDHRHNSHEERNIETIRLLTVFHKLKEKLDND